MQAFLPIFLLICGAALTGGVSIMTSNMNRESVDEGTIGNLSLDQIRSVLAFGATRWADQLSATKCTESMAGHWCRMDEDIVSDVLPTENMARATVFLLYLSKTGGSSMVQSALTFPAMNYELPSPVTKPATLQWVCEQMGWHYHIGERDGRAHISVFYADGFRVIEDRRWIVGNTFAETRKALVSETLDYLIGKFPVLQKIRLPYTMAHIGYSYGHVLTKCQHELECVHLHAAKSWLPTVFRGRAGTDGQYSCFFEPFPLVTGGLTIAGHLDPWHESLRLNSGAQWMLLWLTNSHRDAQCCLASTPSAQCVDSC